MFLLCLVFCFLSNRINAKNASVEGVPQLEDLYPLSDNDHMEQIAAQFQQNPNWEHGNLPISLSDAEETTPNPPSGEAPIGPGVYRTGHLFYPDEMDPYPIDREGVHPHSTHHIFFTRHGS